MFACKEVSSLKDKELEDAYRKESEEKDVCLKGGQCCEEQASCGCLQKRDVALEKVALNVVRHIVYPKLINLEQNLELKIWNKNIPLWLSNCYIFMTDY